MLTQAPARAAAAKAARNRGYRAVSLPDADHFFTDRYALLRQQTVDWLKQQKSWVHGDARRSRPVHAMTTP